MSTRTLRSPGRGRAADPADLPDIIDQLHRTRLQRKGRPTRREVHAATRSVAERLDEAVRWNA